MGCIIEGLGYWGTIFSHLPRGGETLGKLFEGGEGSVQDVQPFLPGSNGRFIFHDLATHIF